MTGPRAPRAERTVTGPTPRVLPRDTTHTEVPAVPDITVRSRVQPISPSAVYLAECAVQRTFPRERQNGPWGT